MLIKATKAVLPVEYFSSISQNDAVGELSLNQFFLTIFFFFGFLSQARSQEFFLYKKPQLISTFTVHLSVDTYDIDDDDFDPPSHINLLVRQPQISVPDYEYVNIYFFNFSFLFVSKVTPFSARGPPASV